MDFILEVILAPFLEFIFESILDLVFDKSINIFIRALIFSIYFIFYFGIGLFLIYSGIAVFSRNALFGVFLNISGLFFIVGFVKLLMNSRSRSSSV